jgi:hypothetical protein
MHPRPPTPITRKDHAAIRPALAPPSFANASASRNGVTVQNA